MKAFVYYGLGINIADTAQLSWTLFYTIGTFSAYGAVYLLPEQVSDLARQTSQSRTPLRTKKHPCG
nr:hypothetical protein [Bacillus pumilus]